MAEHHFVAGESAIWVQPDGDNTEPLYLGCHEVGDITVPYAGSDPIYCPDPAKTNGFKVVGSIATQADLPTTTLNGDLTDSINAVETISGAPFNLYIMKIKKGRRDQFNNWDRLFVLRASRKTEATYAGLAAKSPDNADRSTIEVAITAEEFILGSRLSFARQTVTETQSLTSLVFCNQATERTSDSPAQSSCQTGFIGTEAGSGVTANVLATTDGATWTATSADPFAADKDIAAVRCIETGRDQTRLYAFRGTTTAGSPAALAYSDDSGATWVAANIGSTNGEFVVGDHAVAAIDLNNLWVVTDQGYIYKSEDSGLTWTAQEAGVVTTDPLNAIHMVDNEVGIAGGDGNVLMATVDGGDTWSQVTMPAGQSAANITAVFALDKNRYWVGYSDGDLYYTFDGGDNWYSRSFTGSGSGAVKDIVFANDLQGFLVHNTSAPVGSVHQTINGGYTWEKLSAFTNAGLNKVVICDSQKAFVVGNASGGTGFVAKGLAT